MNKENDKSNNKKCKKVYWMLFWILVVLILVIIGILYVQPYAFFYPVHDEKSYEELKNLPRFEEIIIENGDETLSGWLRYTNDRAETSPLIIMFGGNMQNSSNTCMWFTRENIFDRFSEYNFLIVDYPEYGLSTGKVSEKTMFEAGLKIYDYATSLNCVDSENIVILGFSIGTGVANYVASERNSNGLILVSPYDRALSLYNNAVNIFHGPMKLLMRYKFDSISYAQKIDVSPLIVTSVDDEVISYKFTENLATYFKNVEEYLCIEKANHNDYFSREEVLNSIEKYLENRIEK